MSLSRKHWWAILLVVMIVGLGGLVFMGARTYHDAPPIPDFVAEDGRVLASKETILDGQQVFQRMALMDHGSFFGDGAERGPDFTADALRQTTLAMEAFYGAAERAAGRTPDPDAVAARVRRELKENRHDDASNRTPLSAGQAAALESLVARYGDMLAGRGPDGITSIGPVPNAKDVRAISAFFFWGGWVCAARRPGGDASYTHNWPYDPDAGNVPTPGTTLWSAFGVLGVALGLGFVLYQRGRLERASASHPDPANPLATDDAVDAFVPTPVQRATYKYFAVAAGLFLLQVIAGALTIHDFIGMTTLFGLDLTKILPVTVTRGWHLQLALLWITACWMGASIFLTGRLACPEPRGQRRLVNALFWVLVTVTTGTLVGTWMGPQGLLGTLWRWLGNQGWEFVELGRAWQILLFGAFVLWAAIVFRAVRPALRGKDPWSLPHWMLYAVGSIVLLFLSAFVAGPRENFVIADFWRWCVIHMWAEAFFEVFTTVLVAWMLHAMGLVRRDAAVRTVYFSTILFLGSGFLGISHNFYWNAKPVEMLAIGSVFSSLQVVPLLLLALDAWRTRRLPLAALAEGGSPSTGGSAFGHAETFLFLLGVNFWNVVGAGALGLLINLPIVNYYEHGTYLTVNHGHAALMGVYGNLAIAGMLYCARHLVSGGRWSRGLLRGSFWSINVGLALMVVLDLFPAGVLQLAETMEKGLWWSRSRAFVEGSTFQTLIWLRAVGGYLFLLGGVVPLLTFLWTRRRSLRAAAALPGGTPEGGV